MKSFLFFIAVFVLVVRSDERVYRIPENSQPGTFISNLKMDFKIPFDIIPYFVATVPSMNYDGYFDFDVASGVFKVAKALDREYVCGLLWKRNVCNFTFVLLAASDTHKVTVEIEDVNDNTPKFSKQSIRLSIPESDFVGMTYDLCRVTDDDLGTNSLLRIKSQTRSDHFEVQGISKSVGTLDLTLQLKKKLDREELSKHQLLVTVEDAGKPTLNSYVTIEIDVLDVNDNPPTFENNGRFTVQIPENTRVGSTVMTLMASDKDDGPNGRVMYEVFNTNSETRETFLVGTMTGDIGLHKKLDYESTRRYEMRVIASDMGRPSLSATATIIFEVQDSNDNSPVISLTYLNMKNYGEMIENKFVTSRARNETLIAAVTLTDDDKTEENNVVTCTTSDDRFSLVKYSRSSQLLITEHLFDREKEPWVNFKLICRDNGLPTLESVENIRIKVIDLNDNSPVFDQPAYSVTVDENKPEDHMVLRVVARDADEGNNGTVVYSLEGDEHLRIHQETGVITIATPYDKETQSEHRYQIIASDKGFPFALSSNASLIITVNDVDEAPYFTNNRYVFKIAENQPPMTLVGKLEAGDPDESKEFGNFVFVIEKQDANHFKIDENGFLYAVTSLDRELANSHSLQACVRSTNDKKLQSCVNATILIGDVNDNLPYFITPQICNPEFQKANKDSQKVNNLSRYAHKGSEVTTFTADDPDSNSHDLSGGRSRFKYAMIETFPADLKDALNLNESSGKLVVSGDLSKFNMNFLEMTIQVSETILPAHSSRCNFILELTNDTSSIVQAASLSLLEDRKLILIIIASSSIFLLILITILIIVAYRIRNRSNNMKGKPVRPDLIQNNRKSSEITHFRDMTFGTSPIPSSTLTINTIPTMSTFTKDPILGTPATDSNIISYLSLKRKVHSSDTSSGCSSARDEMVSLLPGYNEMGNSSIDGTPMRCMPPIYNPVKHTADLFPLTLNTRLDPERFSVPTRYIPGEEVRNDDVVGSFQDGHYIRYNDLY